MSKYSFLESDYEGVVIDFFTNKGYEYTPENEIHRKNDDIIIDEDFFSYFNNKYPELLLTKDEIKEFKHEILYSKGTSLYETLYLTHSKLINGTRLDREGEKLVHIDYIDFENPEKNIFKVVNQYSVKDLRLRRPDIVVFINGIPVSVIELKNPVDESVTIYDAYKQLTSTYARDIESLMRFSFISVISDGVKSRYGALFSSFEFFFPWKSLDGKNFSEDGYPSTETLFNGLFNKETLLNFLKNYIYFPDTREKNKMIIPKYYQYYGTELLYENVKKHLKEEGINGDGKGGTYFGATGCGKSYTMLFLTHRISKDISLHNPTIVLITDRTDLNAQLSALFVSSKKYLGEENIISVPSREKLKEILGKTTSGGVFSLTIQKFDEGVGELNKRSNIICISDEAHRSETNLRTTIDKNGNKITGFAKCLHDAFPNATYLGFTGTPIDPTLSVFGPVVCEYNMEQSAKDGSTVAIKYVPVPSEVKLNEEQLKEVDEYYEEQLQRGVSEKNVEESKKSMANVKRILLSKLDIVVNHFLYDYEKRIKEGATINGKAMFVCYDREIAYDVYKRITSLRPEWKEKRKVPCGKEKELSKEKLDSLKETEYVKLVMTSSPEDSAELLKIIGNKKKREEDALLFKDDESNFKVAILVDMWTTGFDCVSLDTLYLFKPSESHSLIQIISRVNRVFKDKDCGYIVDYIGISNELDKALKKYSGGNISYRDNSKEVFDSFEKEYSFLFNMFSSFKGFDLNKFKSVEQKERMKMFQEGVEFVVESEERKKEFIDHVKRLRFSYNVLVSSDKISEDEKVFVDYCVAIKSFITKINDEYSEEVDRMNSDVSSLVDECVVSYLGKEKIEVDLLSKENLERLRKISYPYIKTEILIKTTEKEVALYADVNKIKAKAFSLRFKDIVRKYNERSSISSVKGDNFIEEVSSSLLKILEDIEKAIGEMGSKDMTILESSYQDIIENVLKESNILLDKDEIISLSKKINKVIEEKMKYSDWEKRANIKAIICVDVKRVLKDSLKEYTNEMDKISKEVVEQAESYKKMIS